MFRRILVANRGEIARRVVASCRRLGIETIAVHSEADAGAPHLAEATRAVCLGPGRSADSYLNADAILQAALQTDCQAIHPGYGFLSENALFARRCQLQQLTFIGPPARAIALMGDKATAKTTLGRLGLAAIPGSAGTIGSAQEAAKVAGAIGYPVLLKAAAGGGGRGMRIARSEADLARAFPEAALEAEKAFSDPRLYLEKLIEGARHIEFQVLIDAYGNALHLGERECSIQRSHQKLIEESPSPALRAEERAAIGRRAAESLAAAGYRGAGTVEFLRGPDGALHFMEVNARLQVEHPVTEMLTGLDLVEWQIRIAANEKLGLAQDQVRLDGHALEIRINAEDPDNGFRPDPGTITTWEPPAAPSGELLEFRSGAQRGNGVTMRLDANIAPGQTVPPHYDSLLGKLIVHAPTRTQAIDAALGAASGFRIAGVKTTLPFAIRTLSSAPFRSGQYDLGTVAQLLDPEVARRG